MSIVKTSAAVPFDVQLLIIDAVSMLGFTDVLRTCALICHAWLSRARRHLYSTIILTRRRQFMLLSRTIEDTPKLGSLVLDLCLILSSAGPVPGQWHHCIPFTPHAITLLTSLRLVTFGCYFKPMPAFFIPLMHLFATCRTVKTLSFLPMHFSAFEDFVRVIVSFPCVTALYIAGCDWDMAGKTIEQSEYSEHCKSLRDLKLLGVRDGTMLLQLFVKCDVTGIEWWPADAQKGGQNDSAVLSEYATLENLQLHCPDGNLEWVAEVLTRIRNENFRCLTIIHPCHEQTREETMRQWSHARLDDILSRPAFVHMQQLRLCFLCSPIEAAEAQRWKEDIERIFPRCHRRRLIQLEVVDRNEIE